MTSPSPPHPDPLSTREANISERLLDRDEEILVAYLDGELDAEERRQIEHRMATDSDFRNKMASLEQTWNMLDVLETVPVDKTLVRSTMEMLVLDVEKEIKENEIRRKKRTIPDLLFVILMLFLIGLIGFQLASLVGIRIFTVFMRDIPVIEKLDQLQQIDSIEFLEKLNDEGVFDENSERI